MRIMRRRNSRASTVRLALHRISVKRRFSDNPRSTFAELLCGQQSCHDHAKYCRWANDKDVRCLIERDFSASLPLPVLIRWDSFLIAQIAYSHSRPSVAAASLFSRTVEHGSDGFVGHLASERFDEAYHIVII